MQHAIRDQFHNLKNDPANASLVAEYNANMVAYTHRKNKTPREAQLPVITKFKGMEELMIQVTSKKKTEKLIEQMEQLMIEIEVLLEEDVIDMDEIKQKVKELISKMREFGIQYEDIMYMLWKLGTEKFVMISPSIINEKIEATTNLALQTGDAMKKIYQEQMFDRLNRAEITDRMHAIMAGGSNPRHGGGARLGRPRGRGRGRGYPRQNNGNNNDKWNNNNNQNDGNMNYCYNEGVNGGQCEAFNKFGSWAKNRPNGCRYLHKFGRNNKRSSSQAGLKDIER